MTRPSTAAPIFAVLAIGLMLMAYVCGYYRLGEYSETLYNMEEPETSRIYSFEWECKAFVPAAWIESKMSGRIVNLLRRNRDGFELIFATDLGN